MFQNSITKVNSNTLKTKLLLHRKKKLSISVTPSKKKCGDCEKPNIAAFAPNSTDASMILGIRCYRININIASRVKGFVEIKMKLQNRYFSNSFIFLRLQSRAKAGPQLNLFLLFFSHLWVTLESFINIIGNS